MTRRALRIALTLAGVLVAIAAIGFGVWRWRYPDPAEILARIEVPPAPVLTPGEELATFRTAPGFRIELVASEPLVVDPVAIDWDDEGRLYAVEMRGFMPDIDGTGEDRPVGRVVVLEDEDGDGRMDRSDVFLDRLVLPRAIAVLPEGVLIGSPPDLWLCRNANGNRDRACNERTRLGDYATAGVNPEHQENGLLPGLDGWIYNAKSARRFRLKQGGRALEIGETVFRGQWGIDQDDAGRLFYNHNSAFLYGDAIPAEYALRQPSTAAARTKPGVGIALSRDAEVHGIRVAAGLNRAYMARQLRRDGRQRTPTAVSGLAIQRGHQFGPEYVGDAFIPEASGSAVAHFAIDRDGTQLAAEHRLYDDERWGSREFLASTDERFRAVDAAVGPDGAIWVIDMYRGVIQHAHFVSDYLRRYVETHQLAPPGATGRIWRIVRDDAPIDRQPPSLEGLPSQLAALSHPNGWVRDRAQRRLVFERLPGASAALRDLDAFTPLGRRHALWALEALDGLDSTTLARARTDADPEIRQLGLRVGRALFAQDPIAAIQAIEPLLADPNAAVRIQALHSLGSLPVESRPLATLLEAGRGEDPLTRQAAISGLAELEQVALQQELERTRGGSSEPDEAVQRWIEDLAAAAHLAAIDHHPPLALDTVAALDVDWQKVAILAAVDEAQRSPTSRRVELAAAHSLFEQGAERSEAVAAAIARVRRHFTWPCDPRPGGARPLTPVEQARRERGGQLFAASCAACHGADGRGLSGLAPSLVDSPWVRDSDDWLVRIALHGVAGPIRVDGEDWNGSMPGHGRDPRFDDEALAGVLTHLRRSWGHAEEPVAPETVERIRSQTADRVLPFTVTELFELPIAHRYDRYAGTYRVPIVGIELEILRKQSSLFVGIPGGPSGPIEEAGGGLFVNEELSLQFELDDEGQVLSARATREGLEFPLSKEDTTR